MKITRLMTTLLTTAALLVLFPTLSIAGGEQESLKVNKVTTVTYKGPHKVGDMTLQPGEYKVEHRANSSGEHYVHFTPKDKSLQEVVTPVQCELEPSGKKISNTRTSLVLENGIWRKVGMHFTPGYPISCGWLIRRPRTCCTISE